MCYICKQKGHIARNCPNKEEVMPKKGMFIGLILDKDLEKKRMSGSSKLTIVIAALPLGQKANTARVAANRRHDTRRQ
jgi:hypothetical protein